jgi:hypothetical protein
MNLFQDLSDAQLDELHNLVGPVTVTKDNAVELAARALIMLIKAGVLNEKNKRWDSDPENRAELARLWTENAKMSKLLSRACGEGEPLTADEVAYLERFDDTAPSR